MVLDIPGGLFGQGDVRETATTDTSGLFGTVWTCVGTAFDATNPDTDQVKKDDQEGKIVAEADGITFTTSISLPHGAVVTKVVVYGNAAASAETWGLWRDDIDTINSEKLAGANINTEDTSISFATIDNNNKRYNLGTSTLDTNDAIYSVRITYTI